MEIFRLLFLVGGGGGGGVGEERGKPETVGLLIARLLKGSLHGTYGYHAGQGLRVAGVKFTCFQCK